MAIDISNLQVDSRDYLSIFGDLINSVPNVSQTWNTTDENDPGVAIIKEMAMYGDMLSYNHDKAVLEVYPASVTQRKNAVQVFGLLGYKLHWYQSARCNVTLTNKTSENITIPTFSTFISDQDNITYTYIGNQITLTQNTAVTIEVIQGIPRTPTLSSSSVIPSGNYTWSSVYNFNVLKEDIVGNKIYLGDKTVDESSIILIDNKFRTWTQTNNIDALTYTGTYFELKIDDEDNPYIQLPSYWENFEVNQFQIFYLVSAGINGQIQADRLTRFYADNKEYIANNSDVAVSNSTSTYGYNAETPAEARNNIANYINTYDTLITISDFEKATKRVPGVANCIVTDMTTDPNPLDFDGDGHPFDLASIKIYTTKSDQYADVSNDVLASNIETSLKNHKLMLLKMKVDFDNITYYNWTIRGTIYLKEKVDLNTANNILTDIHTAIKQTYSKDNITYNAIIGYAGLLQVIHSVSDLVYNIDVDGIEYFLVNPDETIVHNIDKTVITGRYKINATGVTTTYTNTLNAPIKPGSVTMSYNQGTNIIYDDKSGGLRCESATFHSGTIDYSTGEIEVTFVTAPYDGLLNITYQKNVMNMVLPDIDTDDLKIAEENIYT